MRLQDEELEDLAASERVGQGADRLQESEEASDYGSDLEGVLARATVLEVRKGYSLVQIEEKPELPEGASPLPDVIRCRTRGSIKRFDLGVSSLVVTGDVVEVLIPPVTGEGEYEAVLTRVKEQQNAFRRLHPTGQAVQTLAANVDQIVIVASAAEPPFRPGFIDRVLACAAASDLPAVLICNKMDLGLPDRDRELLDVYRSLDVEVLLTSAVNGEGLDDVRRLLDGKRSVLCGHSGVGKSSLLIALDESLADEIRIGKVSSQTSKGRHTTTHARLHRVGNAEIIDTPGVREFAPADTDRKNLWGWFPEIAERRENCAFANCTHTVEKDCAIIEAVQSGEIHPRRHESYIRIYKTLPY